jgi:hypothetical protein
MILAIVGKIVMNSPFGSNGYAGPAHYIPTEQTAYLGAVVLIDDDDANM